MLLKFCARVGCNEIVPQGQAYCIKHQAEYEERIKQRQKVYDHTVRTARDKDLHDFYHSPEWRKTQGFVMKKHHGICVYSYVVEHKIVKAGTVHHILELREVWDRRLDIANLIPLSARIHGQVNQWYQDDKKKYQKMFFECLNKWNLEFSGDRGGQKSFGLPQGDRKCP